MSSTSDETPAPTPCLAAAGYTRRSRDLDQYPESFRYDEETQILHVGGGQFAPVTPGVYYFDVSGLRVVQSWLGYRMKNPRGRRSSPLDDIRPERWTGDFTTELLELIWILEATIAGYARQAELLQAVIRKGMMHL